MPNPENITPHQFKPGQSGNPKGRPKSRVPEQLVKIFGSKAKAKKFYSLSAVEINEIGRASCRERVSSPV